MIDAIQMELGLTNEYVEPSRAALYRYGNVSSSSVWYVLAYIEHYKGLKRGDKVLQLAFGSGFKCNSAVWVANKSFTEQHYAWEVRRTQGGSCVGCQQAACSTIALQGDMLRHHLTCMQGPCTLTIRQLMYSSVSQRILSGSGQAGQESR